MLGNSEVGSMANREHLITLKKGANVWNQWRKNHPDAKPDLSDVLLRGVSLSGANLSHANLTGTNLSEASLDNAILTSADLSRAVLRGASVIGTNLSTANLTGAELTEVNLSGADLSGANLEKADLSRANLKKAGLKGTILTDSNLSNANLAGANLDNALLSAAKLNGANLEGATLNGSDLKEANLNGANLSKASLRHAILISANLAGAHLCHADLTHADLANANLSDANLTDAKGFRLDNTFVRSTRFDAKSKDPWSVLRRKYSGPMFLFHVIFLLAFLGTFAARAMLWVGVNKAQEGLAASQQQLITQVYALTDSDSRASADIQRKLRGLLAHNKVQTDLLDRAIAIVKEGLAVSGSQIRTRALYEAITTLGRVKRCLRAVCQDPQPVWRVLVRWEIGHEGHKDSLLALVPFFLAVALILYNLLRWWFTWNVGLLRDAEERTGYAPALSDYDKPALVHKWIMNPLFIVAVAALAYNAYVVLIQTTVILPAT